MATLPELETPRLVLRRLEYTDAEFLVDLLNQPSFLANIGDRGVRDEDGARRYLREGPLAMYEKFGHGLWAVTGKSNDTPMGLCGLLRRDNLPDVDLGYALLPAFWGQGFALEAAEATMAHARRKFELARVIAVVSEGNSASIRLLEKLGMTFERMISMRPGDPDVRLYGRRLSA